MDNRIRFVFDSFGSFRRDNVIGTEIKILFMGNEIGYISFATVNGRTTHFNASFDAEAPYQIVKECCETIDILLKTETPIFATLQYFKGTYYEWVYTPTFFFNRD